MSANWKELQHKIAKIGSRAPHSANGKVSKGASPMLAKRRASSASRASTTSAAKTHEMVGNTLEDRLERFRQSQCQDMAFALRNEDAEMLSRMPSPGSSIGEQLSYSAHQQKPGNYIALDCEFVGTGFKGSVSALGRVSIVNYYGFVLLDTFVKPNGYVTDWRTRWSGVTPGKVRGAPSFDDVQTIVANIMKGKIVIGHHVSNDMKVLKIPHPRSKIIDTQQLARFRAPEADLGKSPGLKKLLHQYLGIEIQSGRSGHSPVEDSQGSMLLFRVFKPEYLRENRMR